MTHLSDEVPVTSANSDGAQRATFAAGCFWGVEAAFRGLDGVLDVTVGHTGGTSTDSEIVPATTFYRAEEYHQRYFERSGHAACGVTIEVP